MKAHKKILLVALLLLGSLVSGCGPNFWNDVPVPADITPPTVSSTNPADSATGTPINQKITITFSELMDPGTISTSTISLMQGTTAVSCTVTYVGVIATLTPASNLAVSAPYTATVTTGVKDLAGNAMVAAKTWSFATGTSTDTSAPTVTSTVPADLATSVAINQQVSATFSKEMDASTITTSTFTLKQGTTVVPCAVAYVGTIATLIPTSNLAVSTLYTATITTSALDLAGNPMAAAKTWSWTTSAAADTTAPTVISTIPADLSTDVYIGSNMSATFSKDMNATTINTSRFTLTHGGVAVSGVVSYAGKVATFNPISDLSTNTLYVATITTGVKDAGGNALAANKVWSFRTAAAGAAAGPAPVNLGVASDYAILSKSAIANTGATKIYGNIGVSPVAASYITDFALVDGDSPLTYSKSIYVYAPESTTPSTGKVFAADYLGSTPADMTAAISAIEAAYTDATGRAASEIVNTGGGLLGGLTLAPGLYTFDTGINIATNLTLAGGANDVWIFKTTGTITLASATQVILSGGAQANNVYWAAADNVALGTTSNMKGNIIGQTRIDMLTGSSLTGRILAQTGVALQAATVTKP